MKIGILTHYFNTINYGGALQAYALCAYINSLGCDAEQLQYVHHTQKAAETKHLLSKLNLKNISRIPSAIYKILNKKKLLQLMQIRRDVFSDFLKNQIRHSQDIYTFDSIAKADGEYDGFIVGSDQVWNFDWFDETYFLPFTSKKKAAYAASFSMERLSDSQKAVVKSRLADFAQISVREEKGIELLSDAGIKTGVVSVDPTLLLPKETWEQVSKERLIAEKYIFVYFLGNAKDSRKYVKQFAKAKKLPIVAISIAGGMLQLEDRGLADRFINNASPFDFISLIRHAEYVFTDSFHATVFSGMFSKQFVVFKRSKTDKMSSRITQILHFYGQEKRFCTEKISWERFNDVLSNAYDSDNAKMATAIEQSKQYIKRFLSE